MFCIGCMFCMPFADHGLTELCCHDCTRLLFRFSARKLFPRAIIVCVCVPAMYGFKYQLTFQQTSSTSVDKTSRNTRFEKVFQTTWSIYSLSFSSVDCMVSSNSSLCASNFNLDAASTAFREVFPPMDGSNVRSMSQCLLANHLAETITRVFKIREESAWCTSSVETQQRVLMFASLALFASVDTFEATWAHVQYDPSVDSLQLVPSVTYPCTRRCP